MRDVGAKKHFYTFCVYHLEILANLKIKKISSLQSNSEIKEELVIRMVRPMVRICFTGEEVTIIKFLRATLYNKINKENQQNYSRIGACLRVSRVLKKKIKAIEHLFLNKYEKISDKI